MRPDMDITHGTRDTYKHGVVTKVIISQELETRAMFLVGYIQQNRQEHSPAPPLYSLPFHRNFRHHDCRHNIYAIYVRL